jgi:VWFA-related protein
MHTESGARSPWSKLRAWPCGQIILRLSVVALPACLALTLAIGAQDKNPKPIASTGVLKASANLVLVDVVVKDKQGHHVQGLRAQDFTVFEDGKPQKISEFSLEDTDSLGPGQKAKLLPSGMYSNRPEYRAPPGPLTVILLDSLNTEWSDQAYMRNQVLHFLETQLRPGQRLAILALDNSLHVLQDFTDDPRILHAAVKGYTPRKSMLVMLGDIQSRLPPSSRMFQGAAQTSSRQELYAHQAENAAATRVRETLEAMRAIGRTLAGYPGRKNLIWFSDAFPLSLPNTGKSQFDSPVPSAGGTSPGISFARLLFETGELLTNARVAIYPVDARGLSGAPEFDASNGSINGLGMHGAIVDAQGTMKDIASWTGGLAFKNRNDLDDALEECLADASSYYVLGYYRTDKIQDGKFHRIMVRLDQPGLEARYRRGYYAMKPVSPASPGTELQNAASPDAVLMSAMKPDAPLETQILFDARLSQRKEVGQIRVPIKLKMDLSDLSSKQLAGGKKLYRVSLHVAVYRSDGRLETHRDWAVNSVVREGSDLLKNGLPMDTELELPPGNYHLRIGVRDLGTDRIGTVDAYLSANQGGK